MVSLATALILIVLSALSQLILIISHSTISPTISGLVRISISLYSIGSPKPISYGVFPVLPLHSAVWSVRSLSYYFLYDVQSFQLSVSMIMLLSNVEFQ